MPLPQVVDLRLHDDVLFQGVDAIDETVTPFDLPRQAVDLDLHDRAAARVGHEHPGEGEYPVTSAATTDSMRASSLERERPRPSGEVSTVVTNDYV